MYVLIFMHHRWAHPSKQFKSSEQSPVQQMCPAAACLPCWPLNQSACACRCLHLPDLLGHMDFLTLSWRVFPYNLWLPVSCKRLQSPTACLGTSWQRRREGPCTSAVTAWPRTSFWVASNFGLHEKPAVSCSTWKADSVPILLPLSQEC